MPNDELKLTLLQRSSVFSFNKKEVLLFLLNVSIEIEKGASYMGVI
jgi:hypothetical protein